MKSLAPVILAVLFLCAIPLGAKAQTFDFNKARATTPVSNLMPILQPEDLIDTPENMIPTETGNKIYDRCLSKIPPRFTNDALYYYCSCSSAATISTIKMSELKELQSRKNWKLGNQTFEKYVHEVVSPCIDMPVEDMEYMSCILYRGSDWRISRLPEYCKCVSVGMRDHVGKFGETELMIEWGSTSRRYDTPLDALWNSNEYNEKKNKIRENCIGSYMKYDPMTGGAPR